MKSGALVTLAALLLLLAPRTSAADADDDCIAASERAVKLSRAGTLLLAREELSACSALACAEALRTSCASRLTELNTQLPTMVFRATDARGADTAAVRLFVDGKLVAESLMGQAIAVDPGSHTFRFEAAQVDAGGADRSHHRGVGRFARRRVGDRRAGERDQLSALGWNRVVARRGAGD